MKNKTKFSKAKTLIATGSTVKDACLKTNLSRGMFHYYEAKGKPKKENHQVIAIPESVSGNVMAFYGSPELVAQVARSLQ
jgi:hypothetical protein